MNEIYNRQLLIFPLQISLLFYFSMNITKKISGFVWDISFSMAAASESRKGCRRTCWSTRWDWGGIGCGRKAHTPSLDTILLLYLNWLWLLLVFSYKRCRFDHASQRPAFNIKFQYKLFLVKPLARCSFGTFQVWVCAYMPRLYAQNACNRENDCPTCRKE